MNAEAAASLFSLAIGCFVFGAIFFHLWPRLRREAFQQDVFAIRNDLHEYVAEHGLSFDDPAYRDARDTLNGAIRWVSHISAVNFLLLFLIAQPRRQHSIRRARERQLEKAISKAKTRLARRFLRFWLRSPSTWLVGVPIGVVVLLRRFAIGRMPNFRNWTSENSPISRAFMDGSQEFGKNPRNKWLTATCTHVY